MISRFLSFLFLIFAISTVYGCISKSDKHNVDNIVLEYEDFGPPSIAYKVIGSPWWQWLPHGDGNPKTRYAIRVVVHKKGKLESIKNVYKISEEKHEDYRYLALEDAIEYLEKSIALLKDPDFENIDLKEKLQQTRAIINSLE